MQSPLAVGIFNQPARYAQLRRGNLPDWLRHHCPHPTENCWRGTAVDKSLPSGKLPICNCILDFFFNFENYCVKSYISTNVHRSYFDELFWEGGVLCLWFRHPQDDWCVVRQNMDWLERVRAEQQPLAPDSSIIIANFITGNIFRTIIIAILSYGRHKWDWEGDEWHLDERYQQMTIKPPDAGETG